MNTGLIFGVFDGLHKGHESLLEQARFRIDHLVVALPSDAVVEKLKGHPPSRSWNERADALRESGFVDDVMVGDDVESEYHVLDIVKPDVILLGYDQRELRNDLRRYFVTNPSRAIRVVVLEPFEPEHYKSSLLKFV